MDSHDGVLLAPTSSSQVAGDPRRKGTAGLDLRGALVDLNAAFCRSGVTETINERGGDCLVTFRGKQRILYVTVRSWFEARAFTVGRGLRPYSDIWGDEEARLVRRRVFVAELVDAEKLMAAWPDLRPIVAVEAIRSVGNPVPNTS